MRNFLFILLAFLIFSCSLEKNANQVELFNNISFTLIEGEKIVEISPEVKDAYFANFNENPFQIPLFKYIEGKNYTIFIAIPYKTDIEHLKQFQLIKSDGLVDSETDSDNFYYKTLQSDDTFIIEFSKDFNDNIVYFLVKTESAETADSLFNYITFSNRIINE